MAHQHAGDLVDALGGDDLALWRIIQHRGVVALELQHEDVKIALDNRVDVATLVSQGGIGLHDAPLLVVDKGVRVAVERVMRQQAQHEGAAQSGVMLVETAYTVAKRGELTGHAATVHALGQAHAVAHLKGADAEEERIRALVGQQERTALLVRVDNAGGQAIDALFAEEVVGNQSGHREPF